MHASAREYAGREVVVTGATGYLASAVIEALRPSGARMLLVSRQDIPPSPGAVSLKADVRTPGCWQKIVQRADVIFHLAGNTSVYAAAKDPGGSLLSTVAPLTHLAAAAREAGRRPRVLYASTATVYGLTPNLPVAEDTELKPITIYDLHKMFAEKELELASNLGLVEGVALRLSNVYGPSPHGSSAEDRGVLNRFAKLAMQGADLCVYGDGGYLRDYVYIDDVVRALLTAGAIAGLSGESFNVGSGTARTVRQAFDLVAEHAERATGKRSRLVDAPWPPAADPIEFRNFTANIDRMAAACGWKPAVSLETGVTRLIDHLLRTAAVHG
jgi:nucleoside-diphosphate-sugar epimerase